MRRISVRAFVRLRLFLAAVILWTAYGCKDSTVGPHLTGHIEGQVMDAETGEPLAGASVTTSPPTEAITTDAEGRFRIEDLEIGDYQVSARQFDYAQTSVSVSVREDRTSSAILFLEREPGAPSLEVEVLAFWNVIEGDSSFVEADYRVRNPGTEEVEAYEVYFRITTDQNDFLHEERGDTLPATQSDIRRFKTYIVDRTATGVFVEGVWTEGQVEGVAPLGGPDQEVEAPWSKQRRTDAPGASSRRSGRLQVVGPRTARGHPGPRRGPEVEEDQP